MSGRCCCVHASAVRQAASARGASFPYRAHERCHAPYAVLCKATAAVSCRCMPGKTKHARSHHV